MKKILLCFLAITLLVCCVGCSDNDNAITCSACSKTFDNTAKFCPYCGESVGNSQNNGNKTLTSTDIIKCLQKVPCIIEIKAVTEDNDPIGQLNKPGGYTALVYFSYELVDQEEVYGDDLIDKGTDAGGCIEVYTTEKDANKRNEYLAAFDGGVLTSGSHTVVGTIVVRTSDELTATQQKLLESNIIAALQGHDDKIVAPKTNSANDSNNNSNNDDDPTAQHTKEDAVNDAEKFANEFTTEYPNDYLTPNYITEYLRVVLGYSETIAVYATENCNISWATHAKKYAQVYLTYEEEFGRPANWWNPSDIEDMLLEDGFSYDIVDAMMATIDWTAQSKKYVKHLSDFIGMQFLS